MIRPKSESPVIYQVAAYLVVISLSIVFFYVAKPILMPIAFGALFALLLYPLTQFFENNGFPRIIAITLTMLIVALVIVGIIVLLSTQIYNFLNELPGIAGRVNDILDNVEWFLFKNFNIQINTRTDLLQNSVTKFMDSGVV